MKTINFYTQNQFFQYKEYQESIGHDILSISTFIDESKIRQIENGKEYIIDLSSSVEFLKSNESQLLLFERLIAAFNTNIQFIADIKCKNDFKYLFRNSFNEFSDLDFTISEEDIVCDEMACSIRQVKKIIDLDDAELSDFINDFSSKLYGHQQFKNQFVELIDSFRVFNKIGEHKVLSLFLMGDSGVGKTEVARCIHKCLKSTEKLAKVNFGNYSSHDALNSLIGSPRGYIGSDGGELLKRITESDIGLILIDEFEKADTAVFNYFLDVLESGKVINSLGEEIDISGYIIVFTSNISKENFKKNLSPELRSRFDYKGMFDLLSNEDKLKYVQCRVSDIIKKYRENVSDIFDTDAHKHIVSEIDVSLYKNMRDLNKNIKSSFVQYISTKKIKDN